MPCHAVPCHATLYHAMPRCTMPCRAVPCHAVLYHAMPRCTMPCRAVPCHAVPCLAMPCRAVPCHAVLYHAMPRCTMPCRAVPCHATLCVSCHALPSRAEPHHDVPHRRIRAHVAKVLPRTRSWRCPAIRRTRSALHAGLDPTIAERAAAQREARERLQRDKEEDFHARMEARMAHNAAKREDEFQSMYADVLAGLGNDSGIMGDTQYTLTHAARTKAQKKRELYEEWDAEVRTEFRLVAIAVAKSAKRAGGEAGQGVTQCLDGGQLELDAR
eukprot:364297-Chlamydomonas_euryale.AAC.8